MTSKSLSKSISLINQKGDRFIEISLWIYYVIGIALCFEFDTWVIGLGVGSICLITFYTCKLLLKQSDIHRYVAAGIFAVFMAQFIYQMHGMFEMHFFAYVGCTILIAYQNWKIQLPLIIIVAIHHSIFAYLQYSGMDQIYFTQLDYMDLRTFTIHTSLAAIIVGICAYWSYQNFEITKKEAINTEFLEARLELNLEITKIIREGGFELSDIDSLIESQSDLLTKHLYIMAKNIKVQQKNILQNNKELQDIAYALAHDLKTPIHGINSVAGWLEDDIKEGNVSEIEDHLKYLKVNSRLMFNKMNALREFLNIGKTDDFTQNIDLKKTITNLQQSFNNQLFTLNVDDFPIFKSNQKLMTLLFHHLIENGIVHSNTEKPVIEIRFLGLNNEKIELGYKDNGVGMTEEDFEKNKGIFETTVKDYESIRVGIGLPLIVKIISTIKGSINLIESNKGLGYKITIPVK